jgi:hypothetical protein
MRQQKKEASADMKTGRKKNRNGAEKNLPFFVTAKEIDRRGSVDCHEYVGLLRPACSRATECASGGRRMPSQLAGHQKKRVKGIEPSSPAWEAGALPLSNTRR